MQIGDIFNQVQKAISGITQGQTQAESVSAIRNNISEGLLTPGNIFEGTVTANSNGNVTIRLQNGGLLKAALDQGVSIKTGEALFFEVKDQNPNTNQIQIRLYQGEGTNNHTIFSALKSAGIGVNQSTITMVESMMENQMPIDKASIQNMAHEIIAFDTASPRTIVDMIKIGIPLNETNITQFENYRSDKYAVMSQMQNMMDEVPKLLSSGTLTREETAQAALDIIETFRSTGESLPAEVNASAAAEASSIAKSDASLQVPSFPPGTHVDEAGNIIVNTIDSEGVSENVNIAGSANSVEDVNTTEDNSLFNNLPETMEKEQIISQIESDYEPVNMLSAKVSDFVSANEFTLLEQMLLPLADEYESVADLFTNETLEYNMTGSQFMNAITQIFSNPENITNEQLSSILGSRAFTAVLGDIMEKQWTITPDEVSKENKIENLYEKLDRQMERFAEAFEKIDRPETHELARQANDVRQNISFLNQINQQYNYVQLPLRMLGKNVHSDLFVYTNKRAMGDSDGTLTAFLHLDMDHLGSTDVSVTMKGRDLSTHFFLEDQAAFDFIEQHLDILTQRLTDKGYSVNISAENKEKKIDFVNDFLKEGQKTRSIHRYSFDVTV